MDLGLAGRACIVTGAGRGIGLATARALAAEGASILLVGRTAGPLEAAGVGEALAADVTEPGAGARIVAACEERFGRLDVLVNNAGTSAVRSLDELTDADWQEQWELNVLAPLHLMQAAAPRMAERGWGRIVNVASSSGRRPSATNAAYSVTKAAELSLSKAFADAYASRGVLINAVAPGPVASEMWLEPAAWPTRWPSARGSRARRSSRTPAGASRSAATATPTRSPP